MRIFVAGGSGILGQRLVPQLTERGHHVVATTTSAAKIGLLERLGAEGVVMDGLDGAAVADAVVAAQPDAIVNQMTALSPAHAGKLNPRQAERFFATTNQLRSEGTDHLVAAAKTQDGCYVVAQSAAIFNLTPTGGPIKTEDDPVLAAKGMENGTEAIQHLEAAVVRAGGAALRYGALYGASAADDQVSMVRRRMLPIVGRGTGYMSWVHVDDAVAATVLALELKARGVFNIVDDEPAPVSEWLPYLARCIGAKPPRRVPSWLAGLVAGDMTVAMMTKGHGFANAKAKRQLGWQPRYRSWRDGFQTELENSGHFDEGHRSSPGHR